MIGVSDMKEHYELIRLPIAEVEESADSPEMRLLKAFIAISGYSVTEIHNVRKRQIEFPAISGDKSWQNVNQVDYHCYK